MEAKEEAKEEEKPEVVQNLQHHFQLFKQKRDGQEKCDSVLRDILDIEQNKDLLELLQLQQKQSYQAIIGDLIKKDSNFLQGSGQ